jgi:hypothetical protein
MKRVVLGIAFAVGVVLALLWGQFATQPTLALGQNWSHSRSSIAQASPSPRRNTPAKKPAASNDGEEKPDFKPFEQVTKNLKKHTGLFTLYQNARTGQTYGEILPSQLNQNYLCTFTLESGVGQYGLYRGMPLGEMLFYFRRVSNSLELVVRNVNFRVKQGSPAQRSVERSFSDSVLYTLPITSIHDQRKSMLVDFSPVFVGDVTQLGSVLGGSSEGGYSIDTGNSYLAPVRAFPQNLELEAVLNFTGKSTDWTALADRRAFTLRVRYSLSLLPTANGYRPRLADNRVGYFITAYKDFSNDRNRERFVRYINRWQLEKQNPAAAMSPPKQPIVFWLENTIPEEYRQPIREGVLMWNRAFEKIGFQDAIQVKQMPNNADWDPADIRYNTIRWFHADDAVFAIGPSRVSPLTGQILDADIAISADFASYIRSQFRVFGDLRQSRPQDLMAQLLNSHNLCREKWLRLPERFEAKRRSLQGLPQLLREQDFCYGIEAASQLHHGAVLLSFRNVLPSSTEMKRFLHEFLRELAAHEVGHTLGLRHNFHGSTMLDPADLHNTAITQTTGLVGSVMDYNPPNIAPDGLPQGDYFTSVVGPYDEWAIAYGYTPIEAVIPAQELPILQSIASRSPEPALAYATDEDFVAFLDPEVNIFDLSSNTLVHAQARMDQARQLWQRLEKRYPGRGESYTEVRDIFDTILGNYFSQVFDLVPYVGGQHFNRHHSGGPDARKPFEPVALAKQRQALTLLQNYVFAEQAFQFSPTLLSELAPSRWNHWGTFLDYRLDYPLHDQIIVLQSLVLSDLLSSDRLVRMLDNELKTPPGEALTLPELFTTLQAGIWTELWQDQQPVKLTSLRRALQRQHMNLLMNMVLRTNALETARTFPDFIVAVRTDAVPEDARSLAWYNLRELRDRISSTLNRQREEMDLATKAHLQESLDRIAKALDAPLRSQ